MISYFPMRIKLSCRNCGTSEQKNNQKKEIISHTYALRLERHWELAIVIVISNDFSRSPFIKSRCSHANSITDYNLIVLNKSILQSRKSVFHAPRNPSVKSSSNLQYLSIQFYRDFKTHSFLLRLESKASQQMKVHGNSLGLPVFL